MAKSNFQFTDPRSGRSVRFSANVPTPTPRAKTPYMPVGGWNPNQVARARNAAKKKMLFG